MAQRWLGEFDLGELQVLVEQPRPSIASRVPSRKRIFEDQRRQEFCWDLRLSEGTLAGFDGPMPRILSREKGSSWVLGVS